VSDVTHTHLTGEVVSTTVNRPANRSLDVVVLAAIGGSMACKAIHSPYRITQRRARQTQGGEKSIFVCGKHWQAPAPHICKNRFLYEVIILTRPKARAPLHYTVRLHTHCQQLWATGVEKRCYASIVLYNFRTTRTVNTAGRVL